jgi:hypothetical protein
LPTDEVDPALVDQGNPCDPRIDREVLRAQSLKASALHGLRPRCGRESTTSWSTVRASRKGTEDRSKTRGAAPGWHRQQAHSGRNGAGEWATPGSAQAGTGTGLEQPRDDQQPVLKTSPVRAAHSFSPARRSGPTSSRRLPPSEEARARAQQRHREQSHHPLQRAVRLVGAVRVLVPENAAHVKGAWTAKKTLAAIPR